MAGTWVAFVVIMALATSETLSSVELDDRTALLVVDVQNDFAHPEGKLYVPGGHEVIPVINELIERARAADAAVIYTQDWHPASTPHFEKDGGTWPTHCVQGTWGAELHRDLFVDGPVVQKGTGGEDGYSGFSVRDPTSGEISATRLGSLLETRGIRRVVVTGLALDVCVRATALDARRLGYDTILAADASRSVNRRPGDGSRAVAEMVRAGVEVR